MIPQPYLTGPPVPPVPPELLELDRMADDMRSLAAPQAVVKSAHTHPNDP